MISAAAVATVESGRFEVGSIDRTPLRTTRSRALFATAALASAI